ncbi:MAG: hypothetical protein C5S47_04640 [Candidatus Methanogasteraceae archaeon]|nr:MAG: hypothetical protein C5S47_04640 [ANME-2 cluster archaeon]
MARFWDVELTRIWRVFITPACASKLRGFGCRILGNHWYVATNTARRDERKNYDSCNKKITSLLWNATCATINIYINTPFWYGILAFSFHLLCTRFLRLMVIRAIFQIDRFKRSVS